ncbi:MAG TPA: energy transducer TonB [Thermoanaerobaculia bacterium]|nr:energy transducer TonB [Thermoanaerobaculia bacterium]
MSESKKCRKCERAIDQWATICPFCNWDQHQTPSAEAQAPSPAASYVPPEEGGLKRKIIMIAAGAMLLFASFGIGMVINRDGAPERAPETLEEQAAEHNSEIQQKPRRADTPLIPAGAGGIEQPITSAPSAAVASTTNPNGLPSQYDRTDATAVSAVEYSEMAKRAKAEKDRMAALVDPRTLTGPAYAQAPRRAVAPRPATPVTAAQQSANGDLPDAVRAPQQARRTVRTRPIAEYQPLPSIDGKGTARLTMLIGPDGHVRQVSIEQPLQRGNTAALLAAVQRWRFKPATENGEPVAAPYSVEINFR